MKRLPQFLSAQQIFIDGFGLFGTAKTVKLPPVEEMTETVISGGFESEEGTGV